MNYSHIVSAWMSACWANKSSDRTTAQIVAEVLHDTTDAEAIFSVSHINH